MGTESLFDELGIRQEEYNMLIIGAHCRRERPSRIPHLNAQSIMTPEKIRTYARFARQHARSFLAQR
ncbi:MAG TPA: hypothetical protein VF779_12135, partial [Pyrinomonadaceae bacterium]